MTTAQRGSKSKHPSLAKGGLILIGNVEPYQLLVKQLLDMLTMDLDMDRAIRHTYLKLKVNLDAP